jgi:hypothetical protein
MHVANAARSVHWQSRREDRIADKPEAYPAGRPAFFRHAGTDLANIGNLAFWHLRIDPEVKRSERERVRQSQRPAEHVLSRFKCVGHTLCDISAQFDAHKLRDTSARCQIKLTNKLRA